jgi:hypothetical protein
LVIRAEVSAQGSSVLRGSFVGEQPTAPGMTGIGRLVLAGYIDARGSEGTTETRVGLC